MPFRNRAKATAIWLSETRVRTAGRVLRRVRGRDNSIDFEGALLRDVRIIVSGNSNQIVISSGCRLNGVTIYIKGDSNQVHIGSDVRFNRGGELWIEDDGCELVIGKESTFEDVHLAVTESGSKLHIGDRCLLAYDIDVRTGDSHAIFDQATGARLNHAASIEIGDDVWIAAHVSILKGVKLASGSVVATRSVVTKSVDDQNVVLAGAPAKVVQQNIRWTRSRSSSQIKADIGTE